MAGLTTLTDFEEDLAAMAGQVGRPRGLADPLQGESGADLRRQHPGPDQSANLAEEREVLRDVARPHPVAQPEALDRLPARDQAAVVHQDRLLREAAED